MAVAAAGAWVTFKEGFTRTSPYILSTPLFIDWTLASSFCACPRIRLSLRCGGGITLGLSQPLATTPAAMVYASYASQALPLLKSLCATTAGLLAMDWQPQEKPRE
jgi:hypothetical protein